MEFGWAWRYEGWLAEVPLVIPRLLFREFCGKTPWIEVNIERRKLAHNEMLGGKPQKHIGLLFSFSARPWLASHNPDLCYVRDASAFPTGLSNKGMTGPMLSKLFKAPNSNHGPIHISCSQRDGRHVEIRGANNLGPKWTCRLKCDVLLCGSFLLSRELVVASVTKNILIYEKWILQ